MLHAVTVRLLRGLHYDKRLLTITFAAQVRALCFLIILVLCHRSFKMIVNRESSAIAKLFSCDIFSRSSAIVLLLLFLSPLI